MPPPKLRIYIDEVLRLAKGDNMYWICIDTVVAVALLATMTLLLMLGIVLTVKAILMILEM